MDYNLSDSSANKFQVLAEESEYFHSSQEAKEYFNSLEGPAQLWCIEGSPVLLKETTETSLSLFQ
ncbi:MAG: hypothetical protein ACJA2S_004520 [Cyclobacteriaceae bacterium]|jgi:hypothetical protein